MSIQKQKQKRAKRKIRHKRIRAKIEGTAQVPRLSVFRSNQHIYAQIVNDEEGKTLVSASDLEIKKLKHNKVKQAFEVGKLIADKANRKGIKKVVFDRGGYQYHGRVKSLAEGARNGGLKF